MYVTVAKILDAIEDNGYTQIRGKLVQRGWAPKPQKDKEFPVWDDVIDGACAIGQAALNLGVDYDGLFSNEALSHLKIDYEAGYVSFTGAVVDMNDGQNLPPKDIAKRIRNLLTPEQLKKRVLVRKRNYTNFKNWRGVTVK